MKHPTRRPSTRKRPLAYPPIMRRRTLRTLLLTAALSGASLAALPALATAATGDLHVFSGSRPDGTPSVVGPWAGLTQGTPSASGPYGVHYANLGQGQWVTATLAAPPDLSFASATVLRRFEAPMSANHSQPQVRTAWENRGHPFAGQSGFGGYLGDGDHGTLTINNPGSVFMQIGCVNLDGVVGSCAGTYHTIERLDLVLHDDDAPTISGSMTGELLDGAWKTAANGRLAVTAADIGTGVYRAFIREGSITHYASIDPANTRCQDAYQANGNAYEFVPTALTLIPCVTSSRDYTPAFDLAALGDGIHTISLGIEDAGGNERTVLVNRTLKVNAPGGTLPDAGSVGPGGCVYQADGSSCIGSPAGGGIGGGGGGGGGGIGGSGSITPVPVLAGPAATPPAVAVEFPAAPTAAPAPQCNGDRCTSTARITIRSGARDVQTVTTRYGARAAIRGRLLTPDGRPIAGAALTVVAEHTGPGARASARSTVRTDAAGEFAYRAPAGLLGRVTFSYRTHLADATDAARYEVRVRVMAGVRLSVDRHTTRNKRAVRFTGRILGAPARWHKLVEMQAYANGRWVAFATTRSRRGRFAYSYRFLRTFSTQTYGFRAVVKGETGWPYVTGTSNRQYVKVRP